MNQATITSRKGRWSILAAGILAIVVAGGFYYFTTTVHRDISGYLTSVYRVERSVIENHPIYEDWATPEKERALRRFLLGAHLDAVRKTGRAPARNDADIAAQAEKKLLVSLSEGDRLYFFYNVKKEYRFLAPFAAEGLNRICERFQRKLNGKTAVPPVKIAVSSCVRPTAYQKDLRGRNENASLESTHPYGVSFDIFYDEYFLALPEPRGVFPLSKRLQAALNHRFGYLLGDSLRRQFRAVLADTLLEMQEEGALYAILEKRQRCYHVTILKK